MGIGSFFGKLLHHDGKKNDRREEDSRNPLSAEAEEPTSDSERYSEGEQAENGQAAEFLNSAAQSEDEPETEQPEIPNAQMHEGKPERRERRYQPKPEIQDVEEEGTVNPYGKESRSATVERPERRERRYQPQASEWNDDDEKTVNPYGKESRSTFTEQSEWRERRYRPQASEWNDDDEKTVNPYGDRMAGGMRTEQGNRTERYRPQPGYQDDNEKTVNPYGGGSYSSSGMRPEPPMNRYQPRPNNWDDDDGETVRPDGMGSHGPFRGELLKQPTQYEPYGSEEPTVDGYSQNTPSKRPEVGGYPLRSGMDGIRSDASIQILFQLENGWKKKRVSVVFEGSMWISDHGRTDLPIPPRGNVDLEITMSVGELYIRNVSGGGAVVFLNENPLYDELERLLVGMVIRIDDVRITVQQIRRL